MAPKGKEKNQKEQGPDPKILCDEAAGHLKTGNYEKSLHAYNMALELNPNDKNALVARSKCYLLLGEPQLALQDAETALKADKNFIRAIFQKAEALYHMGDFEHSLMYYHRGLRLRPELQWFRLGVQKAQEAIENIIGNKTGRSLKAGCIKNKEPSNSRKRIHQQSRRLLGELCVDKEYLEQLLKHPDIKCQSQQDENENRIASFAKEGVEFLSNREEFWRQQHATNNR